MPPRTTPLLSLDFVYTPSADVAKDAQWLVDVLGAAIVFAVEAMGTRVAMVELADGPPHVLLTDHLSDERPILIYRVANLKRSLAAMKRRGWEREETFEIPHGPCCSFTAPGGQRIALYQLTRPGAANSFDGRRDF